MTKTSRPSPVGAGLPVRFLAAVVAVSAGIVLFGPPALVARLGLTQNLERHRGAIGLACLLSVATLFTLLLPLCFTFLRRRLDGWWRQRRGRRRLRELTRSEKNLLNQYVTRETRTLVLDVGSGATSALLLAGIISRAVELDDKALGLAFNIEPWAWTYLRANRHLLESSDLSTARGRTSGHVQAIRHRDRASGPLD